MGRNEKQVGYELDVNGIKSLTDEEIKLILRGADELIMSGGRALLAKILAGSKDKKLLELELDGSPVYGSFKGVSQKDILAKIDWMILNGYLEIENKKVRTRIQEVNHLLENAGGDFKTTPTQEVISFSANKKWHTIPEEFRKQLERNVFCGNCCDVVQIVNYTVKDSPPGILLEGKCKECGGDVARYIE